MENLCACGCGQEVSNPKRRILYGHSANMKPYDPGDGAEHCPCLKISRTACPLEGIEYVTLPALFRQFVTYRMNYQSSNGMTPMSGRTGAAYVILHAHRELLNASKRSRTYAKLIMAYWQHITPEHAGIQLSEGDHLFWDNRPETKIVRVYSMDAVLASLEPREYYLNPDADPEIADDQDAYLEDGETTFISVKALSNLVAFRAEMAAVDAVVLGDGNHGVKSFQKAIGRCRDTGRVYRRHLEKVGRIETYANEIVVEHVTGGFPDRAAHAPNLKHGEFLKMGSGLHDWKLRNSFQTVIGYLPDGDIWHPKRNRYFKSRCRPTAMYDNPVDLMRGCAKGDFIRSGRDGLLKLCTSVDKNGRFRNTWGQANIFPSHYEGVSYLLIPSYLSNNLVSQPPVVGLENLGNYDNDRSSGAHFGDYQEVTVDLRDAEHPKYAYSFIALPGTPPPTGDVGAQMIGFVAAKAAEYHRATVAYWTDVARAMHRRGEEVPEPMLAYTGWTIPPVVEHIPLWWEPVLAPRPVVYASSGTNSDDVVEVPVTGWHSLVHPATLSDEAAQKYLRKIHLYRAAQFAREAMENSLDGLQFLKTGLIIIPLEEAVTLIPPTTREEISEELWGPNDDRNLPPFFTRTKVMTLDVYSTDWAAVYQELYGAVLEETTT